jgi:hypothetical protein
MGIEPILTESQSVLLPLQHSHTKEFLVQVVRLELTTYRLKADYSSH